MRSRVNNLSNSMVAALGIKTLNQNLEGSLKSILKCDPEFILLATRNFFLSEDLWNDLKNADCPKLIILPFDYKYRNQKNAVNDIKIIDSLIEQNNVGVILNSANEANCVLTDKFCYLSSGALDYNGITNYIENYEIMNSNDPNYDLWKSELFDFADREIENYRSIVNRERVREELNRSVDDAIDLFSDGARPITKVFLNEVLESMEDIERAIILGTDAYQYIDRNFVELIKCTKKILIKISCIIDDLTRLILNFDQNNQSKNIKIFNCIRDEFWCLIPLIDDWRELEEVIFYNTRNEWRKPNEGIREFLSENNTPNNKLIKNFYEDVILPSKDCSRSGKNNG